MTTASSLSALPTVTAIIPVYGRDDVIQTIAFLREHPPSGCRLRFIIVDNGNAPSRSERLARLSTADCEVLRLPQNLGGAGAFRAGMTRALESGGDFVWLLDDDALVNADTLPELLSELLRLEREGVPLGAIGSTLLGRRVPFRVTEVGCALSKWTGRLRQRFQGNDIRTLGRRTDEVEYVAAASCLMRMETLREVGIFEDIFIHCDDIDWCFRARKAGYQIFATTKSFVNHMEWEEKFADWLMYYDTRNVLWCLRRHLPLTVFGAWIKLRTQWFLMRLHGRHSAAALMALGFRHAKTGEILTRDRLPTQTLPEVDLTEVLTEGTRFVVIARRKECIDEWARLLEGYSVVFLCRQRNGYVRTLLRQFLAQLRCFFSRCPVLLFDTCCVKNHPFPFLCGRRVFFFMEKGKMKLFKEVRP